jgi:hypothetical protein
VTSGELISENNTDSLPATTMLSKGRQCLSDAVRCFREIYDLLKALNVHPIAEFTNQPDLSPGKLPHSIFA